MKSTCNLLIALIFASANAFTTEPVAFSPATTTSQLALSTSSPSRRDILSEAASIAVVGLSALVNAPAGAAAAGQQPVTAQSAANKAAESFQGVYSDPHHPEGYRVLFKKAGKGGGATMTLSDGVTPWDPEGTEEKTFHNVPVTVKDGSNEMSFDFGFKGGPKHIIGMLADDKQSITFADGNTWTKNPNKYDGVYRDPNHPNGYRVCRKLLGSNTMTEINDTGNWKDSTFIKGKNGSFFDYLGEEKVVGKLSHGTITFPDGTIWTRM